MSMAWLTFISSAWPPLRWRRSRENKINIAKMEEIGILENQSSCWVCGVVGLTIHLRIQFYYTHSTDNQICTKLIKLSLNGSSIDSFIGELFDSFSQFNLLYYVIYSIYLILFGKCVEAPGKFKRAVLGHRQCLSVHCIWNIIFLNTDSLSHRNGPFHHLVENAINRGMIINI